MNTMSVYLLLGILAAVCLVAAVVCARWPFAVCISMAAGAAEILVMLYAGCDAATIEIAALALALLSLWPARRRSG